jgi:hypothetical protein
MAVQIGRNVRPHVDGQVLPEVQRVRGGRGRLGHASFTPGSESSLNDALRPVLTQRLLADIVPDGADICYAGGGLARLVNIRPHALPSAATGGRFAARERRPAASC